MLNNLVAFTKFTFEIRGETFVENWHHGAIAEHIRAVELGQIKNLLINVPPRYTKTEMVVINWIPQCIARNPRSRFMHLSFSDELALDNSSKAKEIINTEEYQALWPVRLKQDSKSKKKWYTTKGGGTYATSAGGAVTGFGAGSASSEEFAGAIIIDDPLKVDDAQSDIERDKVNKRLNTTIKSRRNSRDTPIVIIMQRLHEDDMSGFVLEGGMGEEFHHLKIPAISEGKALWPFKHTLKELEVQRGADPYTFSGQMMQEPSPEDGEFFKKDWFKRYNIGEEPEELIKYGASDYAVTQGSGDFTEQAIAGFSENEDLYFLDWWSGQTTPDKWIAEQQELVRRHDPVLWVAEGGVIRRAVEPFIKNQMQKEGNNYYRLEWISSVRDKATNARSFQGLASNGKVFIPNCAWGNELIDQLIKFPMGKYDDKVDVCGLFGRVLHQTYSPRTEEIQVKTKKDSYDWEDEDEDSWKTL